MRKQDEWYASHHDCKLQVQYSHVDFQGQRGYDATWLESSSAPSRQEGAPPLGSLSSHDRYDRRNGVVGLEQSVDSDPKFLGHLPPSTRSQETRVATVGARHRASQN